MQQSQEMFIMGWKFASAYLIVLHVGLSLPQSLWYLGYCFDFSVIYFLWVDYLRTGAFALLGEYIINNNYISSVGWRHKSPFFFRNILGRSRQISSPKKWHVYCFICGWYLVNITISLYAWKIIENLWIWTRSTRYGNQRQKILLFKNRTKE